MNDHRDMTKRSRKEYKVGDKTYDVPVMVYRCGRCGNELHEDDLPDAPESIEGTKRVIKFSVKPICHHDVPYTMMSVPKGTPV